MGRPRVALAQQKGHLTVLEQLEKRGEEEFATVGREQLARAPTWLVDKIAKSEYRRVVKEFDRLTVIGNLDVNNIAGYCNAFALYRRASKELSGQELTIEKELPGGGIVLVENPLIKIQKMYAEEMRKFGALCGLTIDSRLKIGTVALTKREQSINSRFGDI